jgi:DNA/RNA endonuclease YhcR with UshA esterase domain
LKPLQASHQIFLHTLAVRVARAQIEHGDRFAASCRRTSLRPRVCVNTSSSRKAGAEVAHRTWPSSAARRYNATARSEFFTTHSPVAKRTPREKHRSQIAITAYRLQRKQFVTHRLGSIKELGAVTGKAIRNTNDGDGNINNHKQ